MWFNLIRLYSGAAIIVFLSHLARAQCDTTAVNRELRVAQSYIWADYPRALEASQAAVEKYRGGGTWCEGRALQVLGKTMWANGDYEKSIRSLREAVRISIRAGDLENAARSYLVIANDYYYQAYYDSAESNFIRSRDAFVALNHRTGQIEALHDMALMYHRRGTYAASLKALLESERLKELEPDFVHFVGDFSRGNTYFIDTIYYRDVIAREKSLLLKFRKNRNGIGIYQSLINIGIAYHELADYRRAGYFAAIGSQAMKETGHYPFWYMAAKEYGLAGMQDSCFYFLGRAREEFPRATQIKIATTYEQLGHSHLQFLHPDSALFYFEKALRMNVQMNNRITIPALHLSLARTYRMKGDPEAAEHHLLEGLQGARGISAHAMSDLYGFGLELYEYLEQPARALKFAKMHDQLEDSINRNEDAMTMIRFQTQFETARKERELESQRLVVRNRTITLFSLAGVTVLSIGFVVALYIQRSRIQKQNIQLQESNAEQKALTEEVHHRVKNNLQYIVSLLSLQAQNVESTELVLQIEKIKTQIMTMGIIHQRLYQAQGIQTAHLPSFLNELLDNLMRAFSSQVPVTRQVIIDPIKVDVESAIALGLLINELATNALKHAFHNHRAPAFTLKAVRTGNFIVISVSDNGPGFNLQQASERGFGIRLIHLLLRKLKGTMSQVNPNTIEIQIPGSCIVD